MSTATITTATTTTTRTGWHNGEFRCNCGTIFGKNLNGESPFALVRQHTDSCASYRVANSERKNIDLQNVHTIPGKFVRDSVALSFGPSSGELSNCDHCRLAAACYANRSERFRKASGRRLVRHALAGPIAVITAALRQLKPRSIRWARLSVNGSLPRRADMSRGNWARFTELLAIWVQRCQQRGARVHVPVESRSKASAYRNAFRKLGVDVVVRRTSQASRWQTVADQNDPRAWVVGKITRAVVRREQRDANTAEAHNVARKLRQHGNSVVVCPAIAGDSHCGQCTACASPAVDIVLYPFHG